MIPEYDLPELERKAILLLQTHEPKDRPYWGCFSGGKDSVVIKELAKRAGVNVEWHYNVTTIDPPELVRFIRREHPDVVFERPEKSFFKAMPIRGIPMRIGRWCCDEYKERKIYTQDTRLIMGVRADESPRRKAWKQVSRHQTTKAVVILPILFWKEGQLWEYIRQNCIAYCCLYDEGFKRLGCVGCPMTSSQKRRVEFGRWPQYERLWKKGFKEYWENKTGKLDRNGNLWFGDRNFSNWQEMWNWWLNDEPLPHEDECQGSLDLS